MNCPRCKSANVTVRVVRQQQLVDAHHGCIWWLFVGWWWIPIKWICFTLLALLWKIFKGKKQRLVTYAHKEGVCQDCAYVWNISEQENKENCERLKQERAQKKEERARKKH